MTLDAVAASSVVGGVAVLVLGWAVVVSARSAATGPEWAMAFLRKSRIVWLSVAITGLCLLLLEPRWLGLGIAYLAFVARWMAGRVADGIEEALALGPYVAPPAGRRVAILSRTVLGLAIATTAAAATGLIAGRSRMDLMIVALTAALVLATLAWRLWREGSRQLMEASRQG